MANTTKRTVTSVSINDTFAIFYRTGGGMSYFHRAVSQHTRSRLIRVCDQHAVPDPHGNAFGVRQYNRKVVA